MPASAGSTVGGPPNPLREAPDGAVPDVRSADPAVTRREETSARQEEPSARQEEPSARQEEPSARHEVDTSSAALFDLLENLAGAAGWVFRVESGLVLPTRGLLDLLSLASASALDASDLLACVAAPDRLRVLSRLRRTLRSGAPCRVELSLSPAHGGMRLELSAGRYRLASGTALVGVAIDVSERYRLIGDLAFAARRAAATADLVELRAAPPPAQTTARGALGPAEFDTLAHIAAHDLQGLVRKILFYADLVKRGYPSSTASDDDRPDASTMHLETIVRSATRMKEQIGDLAHYAEVAAAPMERQDLLVSDLIRSTTATLGPDLTDCGAEIVSDGDLPISGDARLLSDALGHLIRNAIQSCAADRPTIRISARRIDAPEAGDPWGRITVADNGVGFDPSQADRIFDLFTRLPDSGARPSAPSATGVGLAICASVARRHGGRIWAEGEPGVGAAFHLDLPITRPPDPSPL